MTTLDPLDIRVRLHELKLLQDGWLDGKGLAPNRDGLDWLADAFDSFCPAGIPLAYLFPTPEGRILAEWSLKPWSPSLEIDLAGKRGVWHALNIETDTELSKELDLSDADDWKWLARRLSNLNGESK